MLQTINGFDLLLVLVIIALAYRAFRLNRECEDYVRQILEVSWDLQKVTEKLYPSNPDYGYCDYCTEAKPIEIYPRCTCDDF